MASRLGRVVSGRFRRRNSLFLSPDKLLFDDNKCQVESVVNWCQRVRWLSTKEPRRLVARLAWYSELQKCAFSTSVPKTDVDKEKKETITVTFVNKDGEEKKIKVPVGMSMLEAAHENEIELEGACEGSLACSTCHVIVMDQEYYDKLSEPTDDENDMLDLAFGLTETSRLGCQVIAQRNLEGMRLALPAATRNFAVDGHVPKPH